MSSHDAKMAAAFAARCEEARAVLRREMEAAGLYERDGWRIMETTRPGRRGSELVMRPIHMRLAAPPGLECVVWIDQDGTEVGSRCFERG